MLDETLEQFVKDVKRIREYITYINLVNKVETSTSASSDTALVNLREHLHSFGVSKKIFEYKSITISLYGILEKHIGVWIKEYINNLPTIINDYSELPDKFREDHFNLSVKLLGLISEKKHSKYEGIEKHSVLSKLNSCIEKTSDFQLNSDAFDINSGNLRHVKIVEALNYLDIKLNPSLKAIGQRQEGFLCDNLSNIKGKGDELFRLIDEIVSRRNEIAHGGDIDNILSLTEFTQYIDFLEGYGRAVFQTLIEKTNQLESEHLYEKIEDVKAIYKAGSVLCFEIDINEICVGDYIIVNLVDNGFIKKKVLEIQLDKKKYDRLLINKPKCICVDLGGGISQGQTFFIKKLENREQGNIRFINCLFNFLSSDPKTSRVLVPYIF